LFKGLEIKLLMVGEDDDAHRAQLEEPVQLLRNAGLSVTAELVAGQPVDVISARAGSDDFDLLVMGAYGGGRLRSMFIGSTTTEMLISCRVPVLLFR